MDPCYLRIDCTSWHSCPYRQSLTTQSSSQVLVHFKAAPATAGFRGTWWQRRKQRLGQPLRRQGAPLVHKNVPQTHIGVECRGRGVIELSKAQAAQVQWAADGDSGGRVWGGRGQEGGRQRLSNGSQTEEVVGGGSSCVGRQRLAALWDCLLLEQGGIRDQTRGHAGGGRESVDPSLHFQFLDA